MTTKLLRQVHDQDQAELAERYNGTDKRQPRRVWCAEALKPELTEPEWLAAQRAVEECGALYRGRDEETHVGFQIYRDLETGMLTSKKEQSELIRSNAAFALNGLRQGVSKRCPITQGPNIAEWIVQLHTLQDIATALNQWRRMGPGREPIPDVRAAKPTVRLVLLGMAAYYDDCDRGTDGWRAA